MPESFKSRVFRWKFNFFPAYRGTGGWVTYIADDFMEVRVKIPLSWRTRNYVGTIYGGSMYSAIDPIYMLMLIQILGPNYIVWDKAANIQFKKPGKDTLFAEFLLTDDEIGEIKRLAETGRSVDRIYNLELKDKDDIVHALIEKTLYVAKKKMKRCDWAKNELAIHYHDTEWGVPLHDDRRLFEFLILEGAQAGLSWDTILRKRDNYRAAFDDFDPEKVARYNEKKIAELLQNDGIIRNRLKIASTIGNAKAFLKVRDEFGSFDKYIWKFTGGRPVVNRWKSIEQVPAKTEISDAISKDMKKRGFNFVGSTIMYAHMQATGMVNDHLVSCFRYNQC